MEEQSEKRNYKAILIICIIVLLIICVFFVFRNNKIDKLDENSNENKVYSIINDFPEGNGIQVFMNYDATEEQITKLGNDLRQIEEISSITFISKEEAYNIIKKRLGENENALRGFTPDIFSVSFIVTIKDEKSVKNLESKIKNLENVREVSSNVRTQK